eukprot:gene14843-biopygen16910
MDSRLVGRAVEARDWHLAAVCGLCVAVCGPVAEVRLPGLPRLSLSPDPITWPMSLSIESVYRVGLGPQCACCSLSPFCCGKAAAKWTQ